MSQWQPLFPGLIFNEEGQPVEVAQVGGEACYAIPDGDFLRHIGAIEVDRQIMARLKERLLPMKDALVEGVMEMTGSTDPFSRAAISASIENMDRVFDMQTALPGADDMRMTLWMTGFRVVVNLHGEVVHMDVPGIEGEE